jgi:uncharacterized protein (TIGR02284 family)
MDNRRIIDILNPLVTGSRDGQQHLLDCADLAHDESLRRLLLRRAAGLGRAAGDLAEIVCDFGGEPQSASRTMATLRRVWLELRTFLLADADDVLIVECQRVEAQAMQRWRSALDTPLPAIVRKAVLRQFEGSQRQHAAAHALRSDARTLLGA